MATEVERKFLINPTEWEKVEKGQGTLYMQGYISTDPSKTVRVRVAGTKGFLTIKGATTGVSRGEFEYEIPVDDAQQMLNSFCPSRIMKTRHEIIYHGKLWEVDVFLDQNEGLIVAEIELNREDETFDLPGWVGEEVSDDARYYNAQLSVKPFNKW